MLVREIMTTEVFSVHEDKDFNFVELSSQVKNIRHVPIVDSEEKLVGIISIRDLLEHLTVAGASHFVPIKELMQSELVVVAPDTEVQDAAKLMLEKGIGSIPVLENEKLVGIVTEKDFVKMFAAQG